MLSQFYIKIANTPVPEEFKRALERVTVENSLHLPDMATLELHDPRLHWVDHADLEPGKPITIAAKAGNGEGPLFDGEIVELEPTFEADTQRLVVRAFDRLHRLNRGRQVRSFIDMTDGDLIEKLAEEVGLHAKVDPTPQVHAYLLQANETNLAFLQRRAAALGYLLYVDGDTLYCVAPENRGQPLELKWGTTLAEFHPRLTTIDQVNDVTVRGWDPKTKQAIIGQAQAARSTPQVGVKQNGGEIAAQAFNIQASYLVANTPVRTQAAADQLAQATADRLGGRFIEADGKTGGKPGLVAGAAVRISGVGKRFGGDYFVTSTTHTYDSDEGYQVSFTISGLHPATLLSLLAPRQEPDMIGGLVVGIITDNNDPEDQGRVKVKFPWLSNDHASDWARVVVVGGGKERGLQFLPEVNDEVLVGFELGDMHYPYVLGGLWNGQDTPAAGGGELISGGQVQRRIIRSRSGHQIVLDDSSDGSSITITDEAGNSIKLDSQKRSLAITAKGDLTIEAGGNVNITGQGQVNIKGKPINLN